MYGRLHIYNICNVLFVVFNIGCAKAPNLGGLIALRFLAGLAGCCPLALGAGSLADMISKEKRGLAMASWILGPITGPIVGPIGRPPVPKFPGSIYTDQGCSRWISNSEQKLEMVILGCSYSGEYDIESFQTRNLLTRVNSRAQLLS
jgi:MFS family permease